MPALTIMSLSPRFNAPLPLIVSAFTDRMRFFPAISDNVPDEIVKLRSAIVELLAASRKIDSTVARVIDIRGDVELRCVDGQILARVGIGDCHRIGPGIAGVGNRRRHDQPGGEPRTDASSVSESFPMEPSNVSDGICDRIALYVTPLAVISSRFDVEAAVTL